MDVRSQLIETTEASSPHDRLLEAGKRLFSRYGYDQTSTAAIAKLARTSESQLVKHFGGKEGLLEAVFEQGWRKMGRDFERLRSLRSPAEKLHLLLDTILSVLEQDQDFSELLLFEARRIRQGGKMIPLTKGYIGLVQTVDALLEQMAAEGMLRSDVKPQAMRSALMGMLEGLIRDRTLARRWNFPADFNTDDLQKLFVMMLGMFSPEHKTARSSRQ